MKHLGYTKCLLVIASISFLNVACQGKMQTGNEVASKVEETDKSLATTPEEVTAKIDLKSIEDAVNASKAAMDDAKIQLDKFSNPDGSIKIWSLLSSGSSQTQTQSLFFIAEKLTQVFDKIVDTIQLAKGKFNDARAKLVVEASKLDPSRPEHQLILAQVNALMAQIDMAESQFTTMIQTLASRLDMVNRGIDVLAAGLGATNPIVGVLLPMLTGQVKMAITHFQSRLRAIQ